MPSRPTQAGASWRPCRRARPASAGPCRGTACPLPASVGDRHRRVGGALHPHGAVDSSRSSRLTSSSSVGGVEQLLAHVLRGLDHRAPAVERGLGAGRAHVPRAGVGVLVEDRESRRVHAQHLGGEQRQRHHRAGAVLLRAGDDRAGAVAVELHVGAGLVAKHGHQPQAKPIASSSGSVALVVADHLERLLERLRRRRRARTAGRSGRDRRRCS